jgi:hypothetical protein
MTNRETFTFEPETLSLDDLSNYDKLAKECSALMDAIEAEGLNGSSDYPDSDPRFTRISEIATILSCFAPHLLDPRFTHAEQDN